MRLPQSVATSTKAAPPADLSNIDRTIWVTVYQSRFISASVRPHVEIEYPSKEDGASPIRTTVSLQPGKAKITLSFSDWKDGQVTSATYEVPVVDPEPIAENTAAQEVAV
jgi:hypothetical protein